MDTITVGSDIKLVGKVDSSTPVGSTATILYVDDFKKVFIEWKNGKIASFSDNQILSNFEKNKSNHKRGLRGITSSEVLHLYSNHNNKITG